MKLLTFKFFVISIYLISTVFSYSENLGIKNLVIHNQAKKLKNVTFTNVNDKSVNLSNYKGQLVIINFWATWCAPCREEMPSLDKLQKSDSLKNLKIIPINVGQEKKEKSINFFKNLSIQNLDLYFDNSINLAKKFALRGLPTSIVINKKGEEVARIVGSIDFTNKNFISWLSSFN